MKKYEQFRKIVKNRMTTEGARKWLTASHVSGETAQRLGLGYYDPEDLEARQALEVADPDLAQAVKLPSIIATYETDGGDYVTAIDSDPRAGLAAYINPSDPAPIWNDTDLYASSGRPILAVTDLRDAIAYAETGAEVVLFKVSSEAQLIRMLKAKPASGPIVIMPDQYHANDDYNVGMLTDYAENLGRKGVYPMVYDFGNFGDFSGAWNTLIDDGADKLNEVVEAVGTWVKADNKASLAQYLTTSAKGQLNDFRNRAYIPKEIIPTGYEDLDVCLNGGLHPALYILGAVSSLGKTTFCLQMADQIAETGQDVLFFTLEQSADEMIGKSISRLTDTLEDTGLKSSWKPSATYILYGAEGVSGQYRASFEAALDYYGEYIAGHVYFIEDDAREVMRRNKETGEYEVVTDSQGNPIQMKDRRIGLDTIRKAIAEHIRITGRKPVVFIDYLQILKPEDETGRKTDKQNMDETVSELRRLTKDHGIPIVAISSMNRANYYVSVDMSAFKESGAIEYSSDVLLGIQYDGMKPGDGDKEKADNKKIAEAEGQKDVRDVLIKILKNRMGKKSNVTMTYRAVYGHFVKREYNPYDDFVDL